MKGLRWSWLWLGLAVAFEKVGHILDDLTPAAVVGPVDDGVAQVLGSPEGVSAEGGFAAGVGACDGGECLADCAKGSDYIVSELVDDFDFDELLHGYLLCRLMTLVSGSNATIKHEFVHQFPVDRFDEALGHRVFVDMFR